MWSYAEAANTVTPPPRPVTIEDDEDDEHYDAADGVPGRRDAVGEIVESRTGLAVETLLVDVCCLVAT